MPTTFTIECLCYNIASHLYFFSSFSSLLFSALCRWHGAKNCYYSKLYLVSNNVDNSFSFFISEPNLCWDVEQQLQYADSHSVTYSWGQYGQEHPMFYWDQHNIKWLFVFYPFFINPLPFPLARAECYKLKTNDWFMEEKKRSKVSWWNFTYYINPKWNDVRLLGLD